MTLVSLAESSRGPLWNGDSRGSTWRARLERSLIIVLKSVYIKYVYIYIYNRAIRTWCVPNSVCGAQTVVKSMKVVRAHANMPCILEVYMHIYIAIYLYTVAVLLLE